MKTIYGPKSSGATPLLSKDGSTLLTNKDAILEMWGEHFNSVPNARHLSMIMLLTDYHRYSAIFFLMNFQPLQKQGKQFNICLLVKHKVLMQFLLNSIKLMDYQCQKQPSCFSACGGRRISHKTSRMLP